MSPPPSMKILLVEDHPLMRAGVRDILRRDFPEAEVGEAGSAREALAAVLAGPWSVVLLDLDLPDRNGLDVLADFKAAAPQVPVLVLSGLPEMEFGYPAIKAGAAGFVAKTDSLEILGAAIRKVSGGGLHVSPALGERLAQSLRPGGASSPHETLSAREFQILVLIGQGCTVGGISTRLSLSVKTVSTYRTRLLKKMGMKTNSQLMHYALVHRLAR